MYPIILFEIKHPKINRRSIEQYLLKCKLILRALLHPTVTRQPFKHVETLNLTIILNCKK